MTFETGACHLQKGRGRVATKEIPEKTGLSISVLGVWNIIALRWQGKNNKGKLYEKRFVNDYLTETFTPSRINGVLNY